SWPLSSGERMLIGLVGPTGVGKTTTAAKIAARAIIEHDRTVTLVACDSFRVGAVDQLRRYAQLLGADFEIARNSRELEAIVDGATTDIVIVDTAGQGSASTDSIEAFLAQGADEGRTLDGRKRHVLMCLPACVRAVDADRFAQVFSGASPTSVVITKLD